MARSDQSKVRAILKYAAMHNDSGVSTRRVSDIVSSLLSESEQLFADGRAPL